MIKREVKVELVGGLGNQLFGYFAGIYFKNKFQTNLTLDFSQVNCVGHLDSDIRNYILVEHSEINRLNYNTSYKILTRKIRDKIYFEFPWLNNIFPLFTKIINDKNISKIDFFKLKKKIIMRGYFGNFEYFDAIKHSVPELELCFPSQNYLELCKQAVQLEPIMVHIRRGDYVSHSHVYGLLSDEYYREAIEIARSKVGDRQIWVFSDDILTAKKIFNKLEEQARFIESDTKLSPAEVLLIFSKGSANIIANSTFSAWGAALNLSSDVKICPSTYFFDGRATPYWPPKKWLPVDSRWET